MIKKLIQLFWFEKTKEDEHRTFRKNFARFKHHGFWGMQERLNKDYRQISEDYITQSIMDERYSKFRVRLFFIIVFLLANCYVLVIKSERYESQTALVVRDLSQGIPSANLGMALLGVGNSSQLQDSMIVEKYLRSLEMYMQLDTTFALTEHYKSNALDIFERLGSNATIEEIVGFYNQHLRISYDEPSGILTVGFSHVEREKAQKIVHFLLESVEFQFNEFNRKRAKKQLAFVEVEFEKTKRQMEASSQALEAYQNDHSLLDPAAQATSSGSIIAELEARLTQKKIEYATKKSYLNESNFELVALKKEIQEIQNSIHTSKTKLAGNNKEDRLNKVLMEYEKLKLQLEFDTEVYKNALIQLQTIKIDVAKNDKTLSVVSRPNLPDGYSYPNKPKAFITILMVTLLAYGIFSMLNAIIKDHKE